MLILIVVLLYAGSWTNPFILDDFGHILENPRLGSWENWPGIFKSPFFEFEEADLAQYYRPLTILTYKLENLLFGKNPFGFHLVNTAFHCFNTLLVYLFCRLITGKEIPAFLAALIFGIHPLQTEEVVYISGLGGLGATAGMLASAYFYVRFLRKRRAVFYLFSIFFFGTGLLYKESALILPVLLIWISSVPGEKTKLRERRSKIRLHLAGYFVVLGAYLFLRASFLVKTDFFSALNAGFWVRLITFGKGLGVYGKLFCFPLGLHFYRSLALLSSGWNAGALFCLGTSLAVLLVIFLRRSRVSPGIVIGSGWFIIALLPFSGLNPIFLESGFLYWAEHFMYFPIIGLGMVLSELIFKLFLSLSKPAMRRRITLVCGLIIVLSYSLLTVRQNRFWSDEMTFFQRMVRFEPHLFRTRGLLGVAYFKKGELEKAIAADAEARKILLLRSGRPREADMGSLDKYSLRVILNRMARAWGNLGRVTECKKTAEELIELFPDSYDGYFLLGRILLKIGEEEEALSWLEKSYRYNPKHFETAVSLIRCHQNLGNFERSKAIWSEASRTIPAFREARKMLKNEEIRK